MVGKYRARALLTLSQTTNFRLFQTERVYRRHEFDENGRKFSKHVENTVGKGEIARYEQLLLFPQGFQKTCTADKGRPGLVWERLNCKLTRHSPVTASQSLE